MYELFFVIGCIAINGKPYLKNLLETFSLLKDQIPRQQIDKLEEYLTGESHNIKKALSREHMLSEGVTEAHVDYVIEEVRRFIPQVKLTDEILSQCGYHNMALADLLWHEYCRINDKNKFEEYESDLKKGLFVIAKAWNEPSEESIKLCIKYLQRIESKTTSSSLDIKELKNNTKDIKEDIRNTERKVEELDRGIVKMNSTAEDTNDMVKEMHQFLLGKSGEEQTISGQEEYNSGRKEDATATTALPNGPKQETTNTEEYSPEEITIYLVTRPDEFQEDIESLQEFIEEQNRCQNAVRLRMQHYIDEAPQDILECKYCYMLAGTMAEDFNQISCYYKNVNRIKLDILQKLRAEVPKVKFSTDSILQFRNNTSFEEACKRRDDLQKKCEENTQRYSADKNAEDESKVELWKKRLEEQNDTIEKMEKDIWSNLDLLTGKVQDKSSMDVREAGAIEDVIEHGDYRKAEEILRSQEWNAEIVALEQTMRGKKEKLGQFISAQATLISNLKAKGAGDEFKQEIIEIYRRTTELSKEWHIGYNTMYEFAEFLLDQGEYQEKYEGIKVGEELKCLYRLSDCTSAEERVRLLGMLGKLYFNVQDYINGEKNYREALDIYDKNGCEKLELRTKIYNDLTQLLWKTNQIEQAEKGIDKNIASLLRVVESNPEVYEPILATAYNFGGLLANKRNQLDKAIEYHEKALEIRVRLVEESSSYNYQPLMDLSSTYNNLGFVYKKKGDYQNSDKYYTEAIKIRRSNAERNPSVFRPKLALVYNNYATMLNVRGDNEEAQKICEKSYAIRSKRNEETDEKEPFNKVVLANTLHEYGIILTDAGEHMYPQAKKYFEEAIEIREKLADADALTYELNLAETYSCYGKLLAQMGDFPLNMRYYRQAKEKMKKACDLCDEYAKKNEGFDTDKIAGVYYNFALLLDKRLKKYSDAEEYYNKAIEGWRYLTKQCRAAFEPKLKKAEAELAELQEHL